MCVDKIPACRCAVHVSLPLDNPLCVNLFCIISWSIPKHFRSGCVFTFLNHNKANYVLGGTAGVLATTCVQPMDLVKTRMQLR